MTRAAPDSRALALLVAGALFMEIFDATVLPTAAPSIARSFGVTSDAVALPIAAYLVAAAALIPLSAWLTERFGARQVFAAAVAVFTVASVLCAAATNLDELTVMRVVQGAGAAMMVPVGRLVVLRTTSPDGVITAIAYLTWPALVAPILAPAVGGVITTFATWRWIFLINLPLGALALALVRLVPPDRGAPRRFDWAGLVGTVLCLAGITCAASLLAARSISTAAGASMLAGGAIAGGWVWWHLQRSARPLVSLVPMRIRTFRVSHTGGSLFRTGVNAVPFLVPLTFQDAFGWSAARSGLVLASLFIGNLAIKPATTTLLRRQGFRTMLIVAAGGATLTVGACALLRPSTPIVPVVLLLAVGGAFRSLGFTAYNTLAFADIARDDLADASTLTSALQQLSLAAGVVWAAVAIAGGAALSTSTVTAHALAFLVLSSIFVPAVVEVSRLPRDAGHLLNGTPRTGRRLW